MVTYTIVFRPKIYITGPPGDGQLTQLLLNLVEAGKLPAGAGRPTALQAAQDALIKAGFLEEQFLR